MSAGRRRDTATLAVAQVFVCELVYFQCEDLNLATQWYCQYKKPTPIRLTHSRHLVVTGKIRMRRGWTAWFNEWWMFWGVNLCPADSDDPGGRDDDSSMCSQRAALLNLLQHEACHLVVILKHKLKSENSALCMDHSLTIQVLFAFVWCQRTPQIKLNCKHCGHDPRLWDLLPVCTMSSWWQQSLCCEMKTSVEIPVGNKRPI